MGETAGENDHWTRRASRHLRRTASMVIRLRLHLALYMVAPAVVSLTVCWWAGLDVKDTLVLVVKLACISGTFAMLYDTLSQVSESVYRKGDKGLWETIKARHDFTGRTFRYAAVHFLYNGPYHMPKLLFLNWMYPGAPNPENAFYKWLWAELVFSPGESLGVLSGVQIMRDGGYIGNVPAKLLADGVQFQSTKWVGHALPHYLSFLTTTDVVSLYMYNFAFKAVFEIFLSILAARPVKNKAGHSHSVFNDGASPVEMSMKMPHDEESQLIHQSSKNGEGANYGAC
eukprot:TRINITY_DN15308_c1_g3_i2.p1 TRINITY_DN15308_c1_g3~~TRINITY_DN15308_c1_g3_i2.p1  ORF type:complete len:286 (+),score=33.44 TRINITY_DN15308_c1_g3_i2:82-939(+)